MTIGMEKRKCDHNVTIMYICQNQGGSVAFVCFHTDLQQVTYSFLNLLNTDV